MTPSWKGESVCRTLHSYSWWTWLIPDELAFARQRREHCQSNWK